MSTTAEDIGSIHSPLTIGARTDIDRWRAFDDGGASDRADTLSPMTQGPHIRPLAEDVFDHVRAEDGEHVGYMEMTADGGFVPYDLLWQRRGEPMDLDEAEDILDAIGLRMLAEDWLLEEDGVWNRVRIREIGRDRVIVGRAVESMSEHVAKTIDIIGGIEVALPTQRLRTTG